MFTYIHGETANDVWKQAYEAVNQTGCYVSSRNGNTKELLHTVMSINNPTQKWITFRTPPISIGYALAELIWMLNGSDDANVINYWNSSLPNYAGNYSNYPGAYGKRIFLNYGMNQLDRVYETLKKHPDSRQAVILIWDPKTDMPNYKGEPNNEDIPCNICSMIKVRNKKLEWTQIMRSNDLVLGMPYDVVQFTSVQEILASWLGVEVGSYNHLSDSLHIYEGKVNTTKIHNINVENMDSLGIMKNSFSNVMRMIYDNMLFISHSTELTETQLINISNQDTGYEAYNNIQKVICAYVANKKLDYNTCDIIMEGCSNKAYKIMWNNWSKKTGGKYYVKNY